MLHGLAAGFLTLVVAAAFPAASAAQATRAELLEQQRARKASLLSTYEPGKLEKGILWFEEVDPLSKVAPRNGFYVQYGFKEKPIGSGLAAGGGWRHDLFDRTARVDLHAGISTRNYQLLLVDFSLPYLADEKIEIGATASYRHNPQEDFYGLGPESLKADRVSFLADYKDFQGRVLARPVRWFEAGLRAGRLLADIGRGTDVRFPSIEELFSEGSAPGLERQPDYNYGELMAAIDYRDQPGNARAGGYYALTWRKYNDIDFDRYSFRKLDAHGQQFFPIFDKKRVIAVQARLLSARPDDGQEVPFYFKPTLGGSTTLRGFHDFRFRDDAVLYLNAEYRWEAFSGLDMALFSDWGTVAPAVDSLSLSELKHDYGIGFRFNTYKAVWMRIDIGFGGGEGIRYFFKFNKAF